MTKFIVPLIVALSFVQLGHCFYGPGDDVVELTPATFNDKVLQGSDAIWLVEFYAPWCGHCQSLAPEWKKAAKALKGIVKIGAVNADEHKTIGGQYGIRGFPTIKIFVSGKSSPMDYNGARSADGIVTEALSQLSKVAKERLSGGGSSGSSGSHGGSSGGSDDSHAGFEAKDVEQLNDANFESKVMKSDDMWLIAFYAPWCGHCKHLAPEWAKAARELKGKVRIGAVDSTVSQTSSSKFKVQGYPTIKFFPAGKRSDKSQWSDAAEDYNGDRTADSIIAWAGEKAAENIPAPEAVQITSQADLNACQERQLCVISIFPVLEDCSASCRNNYLKVIRGLGEKHKKQVWGWLWTEAGAYPELEKSLDLGGFGFPAMAVLNFRKMKYSKLVGPFSDKGIGEFLRDLAFGQGVSSYSVPGSALPALSNSAAWDGKDAPKRAETPSTTIDDEDLPDLEPMDDPLVDRRRQPKKVEL